MLALAIPPVVGPLPPVAVDVAAPDGVVVVPPVVGAGVPLNAGKFAGERPASKPPPSHMSRMIVPTNAAAIAPITSAISSVTGIPFLTRLAWK